MSNKVKVKTHRATKKRLRITKRGKVMSNKKAGASHLLSHKSRKRKRRLKTSTVLPHGAPAVKNIRKLLPNG